MSGNSRQRKRAERVNGCEQCGKAHRKEDGSPLCIGHRSGRPDVPCGRSPIKGGTVCPSHGGSLGHVKSKALERITFASAEGEIAALLRSVDMPDQHPIEGLLEWVRHSSAMYRMLGHMVAELKRDPSIRVFATVDDKGKEHTVKIADEDGIWGVSHTGDAVPHVLVTLYRQWGETAAKAMKLALDAGIDERLVRIAENQTDEVFSALSRAVLVADLAPEQRQALMTALAEELRKMHGGPKVVEGETA